MLLVLGPCLRTTGLVGITWSYQNLEAQKSGLRVRTQISEEGAPPQSGAEEAYLVVLSQDLRGKTWRSLGVWTQTSSKEKLPAGSGTSKEIR